MIFLVIYRLIVFSSWYALLMSHAMNYVHALWEWLLFGLGVTSQKDSFTNTRKVIFFKFWCPKYDISNIYELLFLLAGMSLAPLSTQAVLFISVKRKPSEREIEILLMPVVIKTSVPWAIKKTYRCILVPFYSIYLQN